MKIKKAISLLFALAAIALTLLTLQVVRNAMDAQPVLVSPPVSAVETAEAMMDAICEGDYDTASRMMYGTPNLGVQRDPSSEVGVLLWDAFLESLSYELVGGCYATDSGIAQDILLTGLDFSSVTASLQSRAQELLIQRVEEAEDAGLIYDENGDYREDFVMAVLRDVTLEALEEDARTKEQTITLNLVCKQGQWWVMADPALLSAISGGIAG